MEKREIVQLEAVESIQRNDYTGLFVIAPRVGKTRIVMFAVGDHWNDWKIEIFTPRVDICGSWMMEFGKWGRELMDKWKIEAIPMAQCFPSLKKTDKDLDLLIIDEPQMLSANHLDTIKAKNPKRILMVTGTANQFTRGHLQYKLGITSKFEYPIEQAITDGIISNFHVYVVMVPMSAELDFHMKIGGHKVKISERQRYDFYSAMFEAERIREKTNFERTKWKELYSRKRAEYIYNGQTKIDVARSIQERIKERVIVFTARTSVADTLSPYSYHSKNKKEKNLKKFIEGEINTLSVVQMSDMGITFPNLKYEVVHQLQSNSETSLQKFLRTCNLEEDKEASIIITVYKDTVDEGWTRQAMEGVPESKIDWLELAELDGLMEKLG